MSRSQGSLAKKGQFDDLEDFIRPSGLRHVGKQNAALKLSKKSERSACGLAALTRALISPLLQANDRGAFFVHGASLVHVMYLWPQPMPSPLTGSDTGRLHAEAAGVAHWTGCLRLASMGLEYHSILSPPHGHVQALEPSE